MSSNHGLLCIAAGAPQAEAGRSGAEGTMWRGLIFSRLVVGVIGFAVGAAAIWPRGVRVTVTNRGPEPLADVVVHVTGNSYRLGIFGVGQSQTVFVRARGESHVELGFTGGSGEQLRLNAGGYFEGSGHEGTVTIELQDGAIVWNEHRIKLWPYWL